VIARAGGGLLSAYGRRRRRAIEQWASRADMIQERTLLRLVWTARNTEFGLVHGFERIRSVADYQARVPVRTYVEFRPAWTRVLEGDSSVTWPGRPRYWAKTSGTTAGDKYIPVTRETLAAHRLGGWDALLVAAERAGARHLLEGQLLFLGGSTTLTPVGDGCLAGDLSGIVVRRLPPGLRSLYSPGPGLASLDDWERRIGLIAELIRGQDLRMLSGMPSWIVVLLERVARGGQSRGRPLRDLTECWPHLRVFVHGGVSFAPYQQVFDEWMGRPLDRVELYPASEGFVALQTERSGGLTLMLDYGIFYEFVPVQDLDHPNPRRHTVADVELGMPYAIVLTTPAGLWSYVLGDTIRFVARDPLRLEITGRTRHFVNAFGENVIVEEVERAVVQACRETRAEVVEFTLAPRYPTAKDARGGHDLLVEFRVPPRDRARFAQIADEMLAELNTDYRTKRFGEVGLVAPALVELPPETFYRWLRSVGKLGGQHKVPRVTNDRALADGLLARTPEASRGPALFGAEQAPDESPAARGIHGLG